MQNIEKSIQELDEMIQRLKSSADLLKESCVELAEIKLKLVASFERLRQTGLKLQVVQKNRYLDKTLN